MIREDSLLIGWKENEVRNQIHISYTYEYQTFEKIVRLARFVLYRRENILSQHNINTSVMQLAIQSKKVVHFYIRIKSVIVSYFSAIINVSSFKIKCSFFIYHWKEWELRLLYGKLQNQYLISLLYQVFVPWAYPYCTVIKIRLHSFSDMNFKYTVILSTYSDLCPLEPL